MTNPLDAIKHEVAVSVETMICERTIAINLSRLKDLHPEDLRYVAAQNELFG